MAGDKFLDRRNLSPRQRQLLDRRIKGESIPPPTSSQTATGCLLVPRSDDTPPPPLSYAQERLWVMEQLEPLGAAYNMAALVRLSGNLHFAALQRAFAAIVE